MKQNPPVIIKLHAKKVFIIQGKRINFYDPKVLCDFGWIYMTYKAICVKMKGRYHS